MTNKKPFKLQRGCHTFASFFATCNLYNNKQKGGRAKSPTSCERWALIGPFWQNCVASRRGDVTRKQLVSQRRVIERVVLLFLQLATQQLQLQNGVLHVNFFLQLARQRLLRSKLQEKLLRVPWPYSMQPTLPTAIEKTRVYAVSVPLLIMARFSGQKIPRAQTQNITHSINIGKVIHFIYNVDKGQILFIFWVP